MKHARFALLLWIAVPLGATPLEDYLRSHAVPPADYVLSKLADHRIVILGETHWIADDANLVSQLMPALRQKGVVLAMEILPGSQQDQIENLVTSETWDAALANRILRVADWPYVEYRDILHAAWQTNRQPGDAAALKVIALGPPQDWRAQGIDYDGSMADRVIKEVKAGGKVLVYCGMHHAFTRFLQVEHSDQGRATEFMDRFGNILWRHFAQDVFLIALHKPEWCGPAGKATTLMCAPFDSAIDCAASAAGRPVGFDVADSPIAELKFPSKSFYAFGHPLLRFIDYADGYIWTRPVDALRLVKLIPLEEFAPDEAANPARREEWAKSAADLANPMARPAWRGLRDWRNACGPNLK